MKLPLFFLILVLSALIYMFTHTEGEDVPRIQPIAEETPANTDEQPRVLVTNLKEGDVIQSPLTLTGKARGNWFFEGSFPITIVNWDGLIVGEGYATAEGDWMTTEFVPFTATLTYTLGANTPYNRGAIILKKDNPSGLPEHDASYEIPIVFNEIQK